MVAGGCGVMDISGETRRGKTGLETVERQRAALALRGAGVSYAAIAARLGFANASGAWKAVQRALKTTLQEPADDLRQLELQRLDAMHAAIWPHAMRGHLKSVDTILRLMERRARLLGLDAPKQHHVAVDMTLREMAERAAADAGLDAAWVLAEAERILRSFGRNETEDMR